MKMHFKKSLRHMRGFSNCMIKRRLKNEFEYKNGYFSIKMYIFVEDFNKLKIKVFNDAKIKLIDMNTGKIKRRYQFAHLEKILYYKCR